MKMPRRNSFFVLENPFKSGDWHAHLTTSTPELQEIAQNFAGVLYVTVVPWKVFIDFDPNYDHEEVWLLLHDALTEANNRLMADENLTNTFELDDLDMSGI